MKVELRHLQLLDAVARRGSIHGAARELGVERTTVSRQLARLESALGGTLVDRGTTGVTLTPLGEQALERVRHILRELDELRGIASTSGAPAENRQPPTVRLAGPLLGDAAARWRRDGHVVVTTAAGPPTSYRLLEEGHVDMVVAYEDPLSGDAPRPPDLPTSRHRVRLVAALAHDHRLARVPVLTLAELARESWLLEADGAVRSATMSACERAGFCPRPLLVGDASLVLSAVRAAAGVALVPPSYLSPRQRSVALVTVEPAVWLWEVHVWRGTGPTPASDDPDPGAPSRLGRGDQTPSARTPR